MISADSADALHRVLTQVGTGTAPRPLDAYLAALFALVVVIGVAEPVWRGAFWGLAGFYVLSAFTAAQASLLSLMASAAIGALVAVVVRYAVGSPNVRPRAQQIAQVLLWRGLEIVRMERTSAISGEHRSYLATGAAGVPLRVLVFDRDLASIAPTPGGLGAVEVALSSGLAAAGMPGAAALSAVLLFRIATFWLPVPAGWVAVRVLRRRHAL